MLIHSSARRAARDGLVVEAYAVSGAYPHKCPVGTGQPVNTAPMGSIQIKVAAPTALLARPAVGAKGV